jgi:formamidopyrimidine-DNA glycosylase
MPELPEVETVVRGLREPLVGHTILSVTCTQPKTIRHADLAAFEARLQGQRVTAIDRRAKYILCRLDGGDLLVVHLKMTGRLYVAADDAVTDADRWAHLIIQLDDGRQLRFSDARRFGFAAVVADFAELSPELGPEPLTDDFTPAYMRVRLKRHHKAIKALLLDQGFVAGVGNIYADEALFRAGVHPLRPADSLTRAEADALFAAIRQVLEEGIEREGASVNWYRKPDGTTGEAHLHFYVYDREGQPCVRCGTPIGKIRVGQRGTHFCSACQPPKRKRTPRAASVSVTV